MYIAGYSTRNMGQYIPVSIFIICFWNANNLRDFMFSVYVLTSISTTGNLRLKYADQICMKFSAHSCVLHTVPI